MWYCESGCIERRPGDTIFGVEDTDWNFLRQKQGVPTNWLAGVHIVSCSDCQNAFEPWLRTQAIWGEYLALKARDRRLEGEISAGKRPADEVEREILDHEKGAHEEWNKRASGLIKGWWAARKAEIDATNVKLREEQRAKSEAAKAARAEKTKARGAVSGE